MRLPPAPRLRRTRLSRSTLRRWAARMRSEKVTSRVMTGKIMVMGSETPIQLFTKAPNKRVSVTHSANGDSFTAFDGAAGGWMGSTGRPAREMSAADSESASMDAEFYLPLRIKEIFTQVRRGRPEEINGAMCDVLNGARQGRPPVRLYFDQKTGLLTRMVRYTDTPVGRNPVADRLCGLSGIGWREDSVPLDAGAHQRPVHDSDRRSEEQRADRRREIRETGRVRSIKNAGGARTPKRAEDRSDTALGKIENATLVCAFQ